MKAWMEVERCLTRAASPGIPPGPAAASPAHGAQEAGSSGAGGAALSAQGPGS